MLRYGIAKERWRLRFGAWRGEIEASYLCLQDQSLKWAVLVIPEDLSDSSSVACQASMSVAQASEVQVAETPVLIERFRANLLLWDSTDEDPWSSRDFCQV